MNNPLLETSGSAEEDPQPTSSTVYETLYRQLERGQNDPPFGSVLTVEREENDHLRQYLEELGYMDLKLLSRLFMTTPYPSLDYPDPRVTVSVSVHPESIGMSIENIEGRKRTIIYHDAYPDSVTILDDTHRDDGDFHLGRVVVTLDSADSEQLKHDTVVYTQMLLAKNNEDELSLRRLAARRHGPEAAIQTAIIAPSTRARTLGGIFLRRR